MTETNSDIILSNIREFIQTFFKSEEIRTYLTMCFNNFNYLVTSKILQNAPYVDGYTMNSTLLENIWELIQYLSPKSDEERLASCMVLYTAYAITHTRDSNGIRIKTEKGKHIDPNIIAYGLSLHAFIVAEQILCREIDESLKNRINNRIIHYGSKKILD